MNYLLNELSYFKYIFEFFQLLTYVIKAKIISIQNCFRLLKQATSQNNIKFIVLIKIYNNNTINKMQFGKLTSYEAMQNYMKQMRAISRTQLLGRIYKSSGNKVQEKIQNDITKAFMEIMENASFNYEQPIIKQILAIFNIQKNELDFKTDQEKYRFLNRKILDEVQKILPKQIDQQPNIDYQFNKGEQGNQFEWVGVRSNFPNLRSVFQEILLEKVRLFDQDLTRFTDMVQESEKRQMETVSTARTHSQRCKTQQIQKIQKQKNIKIRRRMKSNLQRKGFTNVLIRDHSQFTLKKWKKNDEKQFQSKVSQFHDNVSKNGQKSPIIFQFVKKYTETTKARDNIYRKWQNRQKGGITPEQLRYLCSTSLFLNKTLNKSEKQRIRKNIQSLGKDLISRLEVNIAQKIIETYKQFMKKVSDLRAHYYQQLTEKRKRQYSIHKKKDNEALKRFNKRSEFLKFKGIFQNICKSQKMKVILNPRVHRWVQLFIKNMKKTTEQKHGKKYKDFKKKAIFNRLHCSKVISTNLLKTKLNFPSSRILQRQQHVGYRQNTKNYIPTSRFEYNSSFEKYITNYNSVKVKDNKSYISQLTGGPTNKKRDTIIVDIVTKSIILSSNNCLKAVVMIQSKWKMVFTRRRYLKDIEDYREQMEKDFKERRQSLKKIYPTGKHIDLKGLQNRLKRVSMRTLNILKPYIRVSKKPINLYTSFCQIKLTLNDLKLKNSKNSARRMAQFGEMVQNNQFKKLMKSGFVLTSKQINSPIFKKKASAIWWSVKNSNAELTRIFLDGGGNPNSMNEDNSTCLHEAMQNGDLQIIFLLLDFGADLNIKNNKKVTPLYYATPKMLKWLGLQQSSVSNDTMSLIDNNGLYFNPETMTDFYPDHYY